MNSDWTKLPSPDDQKMQAFENVIRVCIPNNFEGRSLDAQI